MRQLQVLFDRSRYGFWQHGWLTGCHFKFIVVIQILHIHTFSISMWHLVTRLELFSISLLSLTFALILLCHIVWLSTTFTVCLTDVSVTIHVGYKDNRLLCLLCVCWLDQRDLFSISACVQSHTEELVQYFIHFFVFIKDKQSCLTLCHMALLFFARGEGGMY